MEEMMHDAVISITGTQGGDFGAEDSVIEMVTDGKFFYGGGCSFISYMETELTGLEGTETSVEIDSDGVTLHRRGVLTTDMLFREGEKTKLLYDTQFGSATLAIDTRRIRTDFDENGGEMSIDYVVDMDHAVVGRNKLRMSVKRIGS